MKMSSKEFREIFKKRGWRAKAEGSLHSVLEYEYEDGRIARHIAKFADYFPDTQAVEIPLGYTWKPFDMAVKYVDEVAKKQKTPHSWMHYTGEKRVNFEVQDTEITEAMIEPFFELSKAWVFEQDIAFNLAFYRDEKTLQIPGGMWQIYHLAALAIHKEIEILKMYQEELHAGMTGRFFPMIENDLSYINNAVEYAEKLVEPVVP